MNVYMEVQITIGMQMAVYNALASDAAFSRSCSGLLPLSTGLKP
jgi:hypothetical protein